MVDRESYDEFQNRLQPFVPTLQFISSLREVRQAEWDLIVTDAQFTESSAQHARALRLEQHMFAIYIALSADPFGNIEPRPGWTSTIVMRRGHVSQELMRQPGLSERVAILTHEQLEPVIRTRLGNQHQYFDKLGHSAPSILGSGVSAPGASHDATPTLEPFISTADDRILAGKYKRSAESEAWLLPGDTPDIIPWIVAALADWHNLAPDRFPGIPDWSNEYEWSTSTERVLRENLARLEQERVEILEAFSSRERDLRVQLDEARESAVVYERALLTAQSGELTMAVIRALREIGFRVEDADADARPREFLEDLRIEDPDAPGWLALGEVKGYTGGARTVALTQFIRFERRYTQRTGRAPDALWYIVNQFANRDPSIRQPALHGQDEDVAVFADAGGLVIDTVTLFQLLSRVREGALSSSAARDFLRNSVGRLRLTL